MKEKQLNEQKKINVIFLINELFTNNFISVYESMKKNPFFSVVVITCASLATQYKDEISSQMVFDYLQKNNVDCLNGYDENKKCYIDLTQFNPDYIFVSTPYDIYRPQEYCSTNLSKIAKLCTIEYGAIIINDVENELLNNNFYYNCYFSFINSEKELESETIRNNKEFSKIKDKFVPIGCIKLDKYLYENNKNNYWEKLFKNKNSNKLRIVWKPRWTIENPKFFIKMLKQFINYCQKNENSVELLLIEHPLLRANLRVKKNIKYYKKIIQNIPSNFYIYNDSEFLDYVLEADVLIGEHTSLMSEFSITNKPIIYIGEYSELNEFGKTLIEKDNVVKNFKQIQEKLINMKHVKIDEYSNTKLFNYKNKSSSEYLLEILRNDYENDNNYYRNILYEYIAEVNKLKKILIQGYYEDILNKNIEEFAMISNSLKIWNDEIVRLKSLEKNNDN